MQYNSVWGQLAAHLNSAGVRGIVQLRDNGTSVNIRVQLRTGALSEEFVWKIHEFPPDMEVKEPCADDKIGRMYADLTSAFGRLRPGQDLTVASGLKLWAVVGRSLVLRGVASGRVACAPLQPAGRVATLRAELHGPQLGGRVALRQSAAGSGLLSQLYHVTPARRDSLHRWALLRGDCERGEPVPSPVEGPLAAGRAPGVLTGRTFVSWNGMLDGALSIVIYGDKDTASIAACAPLRPIEPRQAVANWTDLGGTVLLRQDSPYDATLVTVQFRREAVRKAYSYGIDELPTISRGEIGVMCPNVRGVIYNPLGVSADRVPSPGEGSFEQYAVGDLSGKYGPLGENSAVEFVQTEPGKVKRRR
ncbi:hypothetical protein LAZ67_9000008 [Cordylochernes scorpioides]|uniref:Uncharacterized protein n=1 Tax=Cordylochernes scorpioides TaxID=51811 RepID=A0ABY6KS47_9ARAC|nr:hypothetical protein LAZ67_9000008 [Cordylochernes scorpioides]